MHDFVIVGAGAAGCVLANRLSADPANRVLLLEAGGDHRRMNVGVPAAFPKLFRTECDWAYQSEPDANLDGRSIFVPRGKGLGGSSTINAMVYTRGNRADYDEWAALGNEGWSYEEVLPYFKRMESNSRGASEWRGGSGPLRVSDPRDPSPLARAFVRAAEEAGIPRNDEYNGAEQDGAALVQVNQVRGRRFSAADAYLRPVLGRPNLTVLTHVHATRVMVERGRAVGVAYVRDGREEVARAEREVVLCGGAYGTPQLLQLAGIGPAAELSRHGIRPVLDLPGVGRGLQEHPAAPLFVRCSRPETLFAAESLGNLLRYLLLRKGMLTWNGPEAVAFVRTRADLDAPDVEIIFLPVLFMHEALKPPPEHGFTLAAMLLKPKSRGSVTLRSADPLQPPVIRLNLLSDPAGEDLRVLVEGLKVARRIAAAPSLGPYHAGEIDPGPEATGDAELAARVRAVGQTVYHPVGTCRMGGDPMAVVDAALRVHGIEGLRVADASVMPTHVRGHTFAPVVMIGEKAADLILGRTAPPQAASAAEPAALQGVT